MKKLFVAFILCIVFLVGNVMQIFAGEIVKIEPLISLEEAEKLEEVEINSGPPSVGQLAISESRQQL
ncbi:hypothetical protein SAMN04488134_1167 [Amphibacillus marinus]|uniref:Uncharacterized protein n=1 Tax=Amphibacillus marinus TaxID=872970 RepID=A0A1H8TEP4_9BACI|nr:hypothetical protein [Amphibacillus marinus]SEO89305.1 hypothetical protein SAMN04488134_1167 [Amphibacillus marinus]